MTWRGEDTCSLRPSQLESKYGEKVDYKLMKIDETYVKILLPHPSHVVKFLSISVQWIGQNWTICFLDNFSSFKISSSLNPYYFQIAISKVRADPDSLGKEKQHN